MEIAQNMANKLSAYEIDVGTPAIALVLLANTNTDVSSGQQCRAFKPHTHTTTNTTTCF